MRIEDVIWESRVALSSWILISWFLSWKYENFGPFQKITVKEEFFFPNDFQPYMSRPGSVSRAGPVYRDDCSARYLYMRRASPPAAKFRSCRVKRWLHRVFLLLLIHYFGVLFSVLRSFMI